MGQRYFHYNCPLIAIKSLFYCYQTCAGYPGSIDHLETDANSLAEWEVDFIKMDGCNVANEKMIDGYVEFGRLMNKTGRPIM